MYHYKTNAIFATPITGLDLETILVAYKKNVKYLVSKGFKSKLNVMDNQATKAIKAYLTPQESILQPVKPGNHCVNAAERAIQTFKNRFIGALGTTNVNFPVQLWDKMATQVQDAINLVRRSRIDPTKSAYEVLEGPYDWNRYPLAPLGIKAIIYKDANTRASWAPHRLGAWLLGPSKDHYQCNLYYVPETRGYHVSGFANLFPQHCIVPAFTPTTHVQELADELQTTLVAMRRKRRTKNVLQTLAKHMHAYVSSEPMPLPEHQVEQRVDKQRVLDIPTPPVSPKIEKVGVAHRTGLVNNPTLTRVLQSAARSHLRSTCANTPGVITPIY